MNRYRVRPHEDGSWSWALQDEDGKEVASGDCESRGDALKAVREHRGDKMNDLYTSGGDFFRTEITRGGPEGIDLLRPDGSLYGEIDHEVREGGTPQYIDLEPASESSEAVEA